MEKRADDALNFKIHPFFTEYFDFKMGGIGVQGQPSEWSWNKCEINSDKSSNHLHKKYTSVVLLPLTDWDLRKVVNDPDRLAEFDDFATFFYEFICKQIMDEHNKRKDSGKEGAVTQMIMLIDVKDYSYKQLMNFGGKIMTSALGNRKF